MQLHKSVQLHHVIAFRKVLNTCIFHSVGYDIFGDQFSIPTQTKEAIFQIPM